MMDAMAQSLIDRVREIVAAGALDQAIVYSGGLRRAGESVRCGDTSITLEWDAHMVFVDLEPGANWGHACCYLAIGQGTGELIQAPARMPPHLKSESPAFDLLWRGPLAPEWAVWHQSDG